MPKKKLSESKTVKSKGKAERVISTNESSVAEAESRSSKRFPIVGIGASAGGLAAFETFFSAMPADMDPNMSFVLVQHLAPDHKSILSTLVRRYTRMEVFEVEDGMVIKPNCTYVIPPNFDMAFLDGTLHLLAPTSPRGHRLPIDFFFRSLAQDQRDHAICIILSGTGSDGTLGLRAIKGEGGMAMAQNPESTEFDGMPRSAIATGLVDFILPPSEMPAQLISYVDHAFRKQPYQDLTPVSKSVENSQKKIFILLRSKTGHDFSQYKPNTISRRIERRMAVHQIESIEHYVQFLQVNPSELIALFRDLLIGVTNFFRDKEAFTALEKHVIPQLFTGREPGSIIRVWVPGCSTGEEAYSIAILLDEYMDEIRQQFKVQVFATDIDDHAIATARAGLFPTSIMADISQTRLKRYFSLESNGGAYRIHKGIRDMLVFSVQNVIKDPPFSRLELISCRNLLIYMNSDLQKHLMNIFHYALNPGGFLFLGTSETVGEYTDLFSILDRKLKIYQLISDTKGKRQRSLDKLPIPAEETSRILTVTAKSSRSLKIPLRELTEQTLLRQYTPSSVLVNAKGDILYLHGRTGQYLEPSVGEMGISNILKMAREGLRRDLTMALHKAAETQEPVRHPGIQVKTNNHYTGVNLTIQPIYQNREESDKSNVGSVSSSTLFLVVLEDVQPEQESAMLSGSILSPGSTIKSEGENGDESDTRFIALKQQLQAKEEFLQVTLEELETTNEELKSSNEEMQSINEELQSTNEELETSKEELQSVNEELSTLNNELHIKVIDLSRANNDMNNLLAGTEIGTIYVDHQLQIMRFTPAVTSIINLIFTDAGRPIGHIASNVVGYNSLVTDIQDVLTTLKPKEVEVLTNDGIWHMMNIRPYRTLENVIEGAVITFVNISKIKMAQQALLESEVGLRRLAVVVKDAYDAIPVIDLEGNILAWNPAAEKNYGWNVSEAMSMHINDLIPADHREQTSIIMQQLGNQMDVKPFSSFRITRDGRVLPVRITATALYNETGDMYAIATTESVIK
ncbi:MAG: chemotaxis protein CheB [Bacteroidales bacterium]|nr:chemotaxis protein CheB [Bacteroidales bacterium]